MAIDPNRWYPEYRRESHQPERRNIVALVSAILIGGLYLDYRYFPEKLPQIRHQIISILHSHRD